LAEAHLLASLSCDRLSEQLTDLAGVEVVDETPDTRLTPAGKTLAEVDVLADGSKRIIIGTARMLAVK